MTTIHYKANYISSSSVNKLIYQKINNLKQ